MRLQTLKKPESPARGFLVYKIMKTIILFLLLFPALALASFSSYTIEITPDSQFIESSPKIAPRGKISVTERILEVFGTEDALKIAFCESGLNPEAVGDKNTAYQSYGLFQIRALPGRPSPDWLLDPVNNINYAYELYQKEGWQPWSCARILGLI